MANVCAFCGKPLGLLGRENLVCGGTSQPVCKECWGKYLDVSDRERVETLLRSGHPEDPDKLRQS